MRLSATQRRRTARLYERRHREINGAVTLAAVAIALAAGLAITALNGVGHERRRSETLLADIATTANTIGARDWQAVAEGGADARLLAEVRGLRGRLMSELAQLRRADRDNVRMAELSRLGGRYAVATGDEFELFAEGRTDDAERLDEARVDPAFKRLTWMIAGSRADASRRAADAGRLADRGTFAVLILAALGLSLLFWRLSRARRDAQQAFYDPLTGLANRALFADRVSHALSATARRDERVTVMLLDVDDFKNVNDSLGHGFGDDLLIGVGERLLSCTRDSDTVARLGGDEFALLLEGHSGEEGHDVVCARIAEAMAAPFVVQGREIDVTATVGCAFGGTGHEDPDDLLRAADLAMYSGKRGGKGCFVDYEQSMHTALVERLQLEADLRQARERGEMSVHYQPVVDIEGGAVTSVEALARWNHPDRGFVPPSFFIPIAEETGLIRTLGRWVLDEACDRTRRWQIDYPEHRLSVSVNVSPMQLGHGELVGYVAEALRRTGLDPERLILEVTETALVERGDEFLAELEELAGLGVRLAVDDFGVGYSSLAMLSRFPVDIIKIDKLFVDDVADSDGGFSLVGSIIDLGSSLGLVPVAEGVESPGQLAALRELGCSLGQGFLFARPMEPEAVSAILKKAPAAAPAQKRPRWRPQTGLALPDPT